MYSAPPYSSRRAPGFLICGAHRFGNFGDGDVVGTQTVGIDVDLVLLDESAHRGDLGHAGHLLQVGLQVPVLIGAKLREAVRAGIILTSTYCRIQPSPEASGPISVRTPSGSRDVTAERYSSVRERAQ